MWESELDHWKLEPTPTSYCCFIIDAFYHHCFLDFGLINYHQRICCSPCCESHELLRKPSVGSGKLDPFCELSSRPLSPYIILQTSQSLYCPRYLSVPILSSDLSVPILSSRPLSPYIVHQTSQSLYCHPHLSVPILSSDLSVPICIILQTSQSLYCVPDLSVPTLSSRPLSHYIVLQTAQTLQYVLYIVLLPFI